MAVQWEKQWVQYIAFFILLIGLFISLLLHSVMIGGIVMFLAGLVAGRVWYLKRYKEQILPHSLIIGGFVLGIAVGSMWSSRLLNVVLFFVGAYMGYILHQKGYITFKSQMFIK